MRRMLRVDIMAFLLAWMVACSGSSDSSFPPRTIPVPSPNRSGIRGVVQIGPQCPAQREGEECPPEPAEIDLVVRKSMAPAGPKGPIGGQGDVVAQTRSGPDGRFQVTIAPGAYVVEAALHAGLSCQPLEVIVEPDRYAEVMVHCDSGIR